MKNERLVLRDPEKREERSCVLVDGVASLNVLGQSSKEGVAVWWAVARNLDGRAVAADDGTVAVTNTVGVLAGSGTEIRSECSDLGGGGCTGSSTRRSVVSRWGGSRGSRGGCGWGIGLSVDSLVLGLEGGGHNRATNTWSVQVLQCNRSSVDASVLGCLRVVGGEGDGHAWVVQDVASVNVRVEFLIENEVNKF